MKGVTYIYSIVHLPLGGSLNITCQHLLVRQSGKPTLLSGLGSTFKVYL